MEKGSGNWEGIRNTMRPNGKREKALQSQTGMGQEYICFSVLMPRILFPATRERERKETLFWCARCLFLILCVRCLFFFYYTRAC